MDDTSTPDSQATEKKIKDRRGSSPNSRANLIPFKKGAEWKGNRLGRPKTFDEFRALARELAAKELVTEKGERISVGEAILRTWAKSKEPQLQRAFIEYAFGKVPDKLDPSDLPPKTTLILHYGHEREQRDRDHKRLSSDLSQGAD